MRIKKSPWIAALSQDSGVSGPHVTLGHMSYRSAVIDARYWAQGQIGHPWDRLTISRDDEWHTVRQTTESTAAKHRQHFVSLRCD